MAWMACGGVPAVADACTRGVGFVSGSGRACRVPRGAQVTCPRRVREKRVRHPVHRGVRSAVPRGDDPSTTYTFGSKTPPDDKHRRTRPPPPSFMRFDVVKTLVVPVSEPRHVSRLEGRGPKSLESWIAKPENVMSVVFEEGGVDLIRKDLWRILVVRLQFMDWELCPEFDLEVLPFNSVAAKNENAVRMRSQTLRLSQKNEKKNTKRAPPGFAGMDVWSDIECELFVRRGTGGIEDNSPVFGTTAVCASLKITIAADVPWGLRILPYFQSAGEIAIASSIDGVGKSARGRVQAAYTQWAEDGGDVGVNGVTEVVQKGEGVRVE
jgi:hypothetical protein